MPPVTVRLLSDDPSPVRIVGAVVEFYDTDAVFQTGGTTDVDGEVEVTLPDGNYDVYVFKVGITVLPRQPHRIVVDTLLDNIFEVTGRIRVSPESTDPLRCTVSGSIVGVDGGNAKHRLIFVPKKSVIVTSGLVIAPNSRREVASTDEGYFEFDLLRDTHYDAFFVAPEDLFGETPGKLDIRVPDRPGVALCDLLFPVPVHLEFSLSEIALSVGGPIDESIEVDLHFSDGSNRDTFSTPWAYVSLTNTDSTVVEASFLFGSPVLYLKPISPGTATITTVRTMADKAYFDPLPAYVTESVEVTVT